MTTLAHDRTRASLASTPRLAGAARPESYAASLPTAARLNAALAILRVIAGTVFLAHGAQKVFVFGFAGVAGAFGGMGVPLPGLAGPAVALLELLGGLALIAGLFTRLAALGLAVTMLGAIVLVHLAAGFFLPNGVEFALILFGAAAALALTGPGAFSLDAVLARLRARG
ncbi:MAG TPA: DoxX family protein [Longimicrobiaceae bacterium]